jgi:hypothetical protein
MCENDYNTYKNYRWPRNLQHNTYIPKAHKTRDAEKFLKEQNKIFTVVDCVADCEVSE